ncbi:MAG: hypothetical protein EXR43_00175 [Dehalococcoidia bacterium]|nr:hypothetical protein [Dehalococcoidia bacterium]
MATSVETMVGIRFRDAGRIFSFDAGDLQLDLSEYVVAETQRGPELGRVVIAPGQMLAGESGRDIPPILRIATAEDRDAASQRQAEAAQAVGAARRVANAEGLRLTIASADMNLDGTSLTLYYESDENVDYRAIVRELREAMDTDVQVEHIGSRDRARLVDGYDRCGLRLCCASWMSSFPSVSIKMAKEQNLALNPAKISGVCGRLYCCLTFEYEQYRELRGTLPKLNSHVSTPSGDAKVIAVNPLGQSVTLLMEADHSRIEVTKEQLEFGKLVRPIGLTLGEPTPEEDGYPAPPPPATMISRFPPREQRGGRPLPPQSRVERPRGPRPEQGAGDRSLRSRRRRDEGGAPPETGTTHLQPAPTAASPQRPFARQRPGASPPQAQGTPPAGSDIQGTDDPARRKRRRRRRRGGGGGEGGGPAASTGPAD